jgi:uncharacterized protein (TIGR03437 family)
MELATFRVAMWIALPWAAVAQTPVVQNVLSQASFEALVSPGMPIVVNGTNLSAGGYIDCPGPRVPLTCGSVTVTVGNRAVPVRSVYPTQVVTYIPVDQATGGTTLVVKNHAGVSTPPFAISVLPMAPGCHRMA